ncbi:hypothetical protein SAMN05216455_101240 [Segatella bryantii]|jgi:hypothetical protein|nr:hypothetical protein SAMN04487899_10439 [Segatella bryantii]SDZ78599.1 hypothetical protein SAMN05216455_101240 [Segatella bryantii]
MIKYRLRLMCSGSVNKKADLHIGASLIFTYMILLSN